MGATRESRAVGGSIDVSGLGVGEHGGTAEVLGHHVLIDGTARIDARGTSGGGTVLVGGNWQGKGPQRRAEQTIMAMGSQIDASATEQGAGGTVVVWSDIWTRFYGGCGHVAERQGVMVGGWRLRVRKFFRWGEE